MTWPVHQISPRPWAAVCATCGHVLLVVLVAGGVATGLTSALDGLTAGWPTSGGRP